MPRLTKDSFIGEGVAVVAACGGVVLGIGLYYNNHAPEQAASCLALHQTAANQLRGNQLRWKEVRGHGAELEFLRGDGSGCYGQE